MFSHAWFWMNFTFVTPFLFGTLLLLPKIQKRKLFWVKTLGTYAALWGWTILWTWIVKTVPGSVSSNMYFTHTTFIVQIAVVMCYLMMSYRMNIWGAIFATTVAYSLQHITDRSNLVIQQLIRIFSNETIESFWGKWYGMLLWLVLAILIYGAWYHTTFKKLNPDSFNKLYNTKKQVCISVAVVLASIYLNSIIGLQSGVTLVTSTAGFAMSCIISALVILLNYSLVTEQRQKDENEKLNILLIEGKKDYEASKDSIDILNVKLHDIKHLLQTLNTSTSQETINNIKDSLVEFERRIKTGNEAIDVIVNKKEHECIANNIAFTCFLDARNLDYISSYELYTLFDNAIGNAVGAAKNCEQERKVISIHGQRTDENITITFTNYIPKGDDITLVNGFPVTKQDKNYHGFGVRSMQMLSEKHNGSIKCEIYEDLFNLYVTLPLEK